MIFGPLVSSKDARRKPPKRVVKRRDRPRWPRVHEAIEVLQKTVRPLSGAVEVPRVVEVVEVHGLLALGPVPAATRGYSRRGGRTAPGVRGSSGAGRRRGRDDGSSVDESAADARGYEGPRRRGADASARPATAAARPRRRRGRGRRTLRSAGRWPAASRRPRPRPWSRSRAASSCAGRPRARPRWTSARIPSCRASSSPGVRRDASR